jgi:hypothetical protein
MVHIRLYTWLEDIHLIRFSQDRTRQDKTGQDKTGQDKTRSLSPGGSERRRGSPAPRLAESSSIITASALPIVPCGKHPFLCLSRACLGKSSSFLYIKGFQKVFSAPQGGGTRHRSPGRPAARHRRPHRRPGACRGPRPWKFYCRAPARHGASPPHPSSLRRCQCPRGRTCDSSSSQQHSGRAGRRVCRYRRVRGPG